MHYYDYLAISSALVFNFVVLISLQDSRNFSSHTVNCLGNRCPSEASTWDITDGQLYTIHWSTATVSKQIYNALQITRNAVKVRPRYRLFNFRSMASTGAGILSMPTQALKCTVENSLLPLLQRAAAKNSPPSTCLHGAGEADLYCVQFVEIS